MAASEAPTSPLGTSGSPWSTSTFGWPVDPLEHVPDMLWPQSISVLGRMRRDPVIASVLAAYCTPIIGADWRIDPRGADERAIKLCADSLGIPVVGAKVDEPGPVRRRGVRWAEHVRLSLLSLTFGHMPFEPVYELRDGLAYLVALPERMPSTLTEIKANDDGSLMSIVQEAPIGSGSKANPMGVEIPAERLLYYCHEREGSNWAGTALIRPAYSMWLLKMDTIRANAIGIKRWSSGIPVAEPLPGTNPTPAQIADAQAMVSGARGGETAGAVPVGFKLRIIGIEGTLPDALPTLQYYDAQIARSCLTSILDLGNTATGSRALGDNFADLLGRALQSTGERMAETATTLCERLVNFNFGEDAPVPAVTCGDVAASKASVAESIVNLIQVGAIRPDAGLEAFIREGFDLPEAGTPYAPAPKPGAPSSAPVVPAPAAVPVDVPPADQAGAPQKVAAKATPDGWAPWTGIRAAGGADAHAGPERHLVDWFDRGADGQIPWGRHGDWAACLRIAAKHMPLEESKAFCANRHKEATGEWPGPNAHKGIHAAAGDAQPEPDMAPQYRQPTPAEQAAGVDPARIDADHQQLLAEGAILLAPVLAAWGTALTAQLGAAMAAGHLAAFARAARLNTADADSALRDLMTSASRVGVQQGIDEAAAAGASHGLTPDDVHAPIDMQWASAAAEQAASAMATAAGSAALAQPPGTDPQEAAQAAVGAVQANTRPADTLILQAVNRAMSGGRVAAQQAVIDATPDIDWIIFHSAIRDKGTCELCLTHDGTAYPSIAAARPDFYLGRYTECLGRDRCRCILAMHPSTIPTPMVGDPAFGGGMNVTRGGQ